MPYARTVPRRAAAPLLAAAALAGAASCSEPAPEGNGRTTTSVRVVNTSSVTMYAGFSRFDTRPNGLRGMAAQAVRSNGEAIIQVPDHGWVVIAQSADAGAERSWQNRIRDGVTAIEARVNAKTGQIEAKMRR